MLSFLYPALPSPPPHPACDIPSNGKPRASRTDGATHNLAFDPYLISVRQSLCDIFEANQEWSRANQLITSIPSDTVAALPDSGFSIKFRIAHIFIAAGHFEPAELNINLPANSPSARNRKCRASRLTGANHTPAEHKITHNIFSQSPSAFDSLAATAALDEKACILVTMPSIVSQFFCSSDSPATAATLDLEADIFKVPAPRVWQDHNLLLLLKTASFCPSPPLARCYTTLPRPLAL